STQTRGHNAGEVSRGVIQGGGNVATSDNTDLILSTGRYAADRSITDHGAGFSHSRFVLHLNGVLGIFVISVEGNDASSQLNLASFRSVSDDGANFTTNFDQNLTGERQTRQFDLQGAGYATFANPRQDSRRAITSQREASKDFAFGTSGRTNYGFVTLLDSNQGNTFFGQEQTVLDCAVFGQEQASILLYEHGFLSRLTACAEAAHGLFQSQSEVLVGLGRRLRFNPFFLHRCHRTAYRQGLGGRRCRCGFSYGGGELVLYVQVVVHDDTSLSQQFFVVAIAVGDKRLIHQSLSVLNADGRQGADQGLGDQVGAVFEETTSDTGSCQIGRASCRGTE